jgi:hypothetical protein
MLFISPDKAKPAVRQGRKATDLRMYHKRLVCEMAQSRRLSYIKMAGLPGVGSPAFFVVGRLLEQFR